MVTITKPPKRNNTILCKKIVAFISLIILLWVGVHWLSWFHATFILSDDANSYNNQLRNRKQQHQPLPKIIGVPQPKQQQPQQRKDNIADQQKQQYQQKVQNILSTISKLSNAIPLSQDTTTNSDDNNLSTKFTSIISKQCIPGRDDTSTGEINPTTHRKRECLRHVPLGKHHTTSDVEHSFQTQKPRIGIFVPPTFIGQSMALLIQHVILQTGDEIHMLDVEIIITSHVPVYGYGKSHGYTKLIRVVEMPLSLGVMDAYLYSSSMLLNGSDGSDHHDYDWTIKEGKDNEVAENRGGGRNEYYQNALKDTIDELKLGRRVQPPSIGTVGQLVSLMMRWHCRMSHVSAHTAMITLSLEDLLTDPTTIISNILSFIWREDWDWEGHNGGQTHPHQSQPKYATWKLEAEEIVTQQLKDTSSLLYMLTKHTQLLLHETISTNDDESDDDNNAFKKSIQGAFASEMKRSSDMTSWPCPSFWEGVDTSTAAAASDDDDQLRILQQISNEMIPNCRDDDPFVRCSVNKDKCEVKRDAKCK